MKIMIFGAGGQVGHEVCRAAWPTLWAIAPLDRSAIDITKAAAVSSVISRQKPDLVINLAAYTAVDGAESEPETAWAVNCAGAAHIAAACGDSSTPLIHLSTDYVFDGSKPGPYQEEDVVNPLGVYGQSKKAGERAVRAAVAHHIILRTAWVYGVHGTNFVRTMPRLGAERSSLRVVADQHGCPTAARDIASALIVIAGHIERGSANWGTFHFAGAGAVSWHGFGEAIFNIAALRRGDPAASRADYHRAIPDGGASADEFRARLHEDHRSFWNLTAAMADEPHCSSSGTTRSKARRMSSPALGYIILRPRSSSRIRSAEQPKACRTVVTVISGASGVS